MASADVVPLAEKRPSATLPLHLADLRSLNRDAQTYGGATGHSSVRQ